MGHEQAYAERPIPFGYTRYKSLMEARKTHKGYLSLGVCPRRCSTGKHLEPQAVAWEGTALAKTKRCPLCARTLLRMSPRQWDSQVLMAATL